MILYDFLLLTTSDVILYSSDLVRLGSTDVDLLLDDYFGDYEVLSVGSCGGFLVVDIDITASDAFDIMNQLEDLCNDVC